MAFSNAARVMISRGRMFFSSRFLIVAPTESASAIFSGYSAGNEEDPGRHMPRASIAEAIVLAVYICRQHTSRIGDSLLHKLRNRDKHF
jgi:hypothetical protein